MTQPTTSRRAALRSVALIAAAPAVVMAVGAAPAATARTDVSRRLDRTIALYRRASAEVDRFDEEVIALLWAVAVKRLALAHLVDGLVHRRDDRGRERLGDITDTEPDHFRVGMRGRVRADAPANLRKQIARRKLRVVLVDTCHGRGGRYPEQPFCRQRSSEGA